jgi:hypothetical protein
MKKVMKKRRRPLFNALDLKEKAGPVRKDPEAPF